MNGHNADACGLLLDEPDTVQLGKQRIDRLPLYNRLGTTTGIVD